MTDLTNPNSERFRKTPSDESVEGCLGASSAGQGEVTPSALATPPPLDLAALTAIANAATTQGEWTPATSGGGEDVYSNWETEHGEYAQRVAKVGDDPDARHIAAFDPPTVLALIARATAAEAKIAAVRGVLEHHIFVADDKYGDLAASQYYGDSELDAVAAKSVTRALDGTA